MNGFPIGGRLSLVIPAFDEAAVIARAVREAEAALAATFPGFEILVVDDGSRDDTANIVESLRTECPNTRLIRHPGNRGYGAALRTGFAAARHALVAFTDADCQFDLTELRELAMIANQFPIVVGYRVDRQDPWRRRFLSRGYNFLARTLLGTGVRDCDCALKVFRREVLDDLMPEARGFFVNTEMLTRARQRGYGVAEVPVTHRPRAGGASKVSLREVPRTFRTLVAFWWRAVLFAPRTGTVFQTRVTLPGRAALPTTPAPVTAPRPSSAPALRAGHPGPRRGAA